MKKIYIIGGTIFALVFVFAVYTSETKRLNGLRNNKEDNKAKEITTQNDFGTNENIKTLKTGEDDKKTEIKYIILDSSSVYLEKCVMNIQLTKEYYKTDIERFAYYVKDQLLTKKYKRIFIFYYLPTMNQKGTPWALTHFNPDLEISIPPYYDNTKSKVSFDNKDNMADNLFYSFNERSNKIIGKWIEPSDALLYFYKTSSGKYFLTEINTNNQNGRDPYVTELVTRKEKGRRAYVIKRYIGETDPVTGERWIDEEYTDYYQIDSNGDLVLSDKDGIISKYLKVE